jgi:hypothetical protein
MKTSKTSSRKTPAQKAKERLNAAMAEPETTAASPTAPKTSAPPANTPSTTIATTTPASPVPKHWRITTFSEIANVDEWFQDKLLYILAHLLRKGRILKRRLVEFTFPEKGPVEITWQDIATGEIIEEKATGGVVTDEEDPLA